MMRTIYGVVIECRMDVLTLEWCFKSNVIMIEICSRLSFAAAHIGLTLRNGRQIKSELLVLKIEPSVRRLGSI